MTGQLRIASPSGVHSITRPADAQGKGRVASLSRADQRPTCDLRLRCYNAQDLLVALFRLAVADAIADSSADHLSAGGWRWKLDAESFIVSDWAVELAEMGQLPIAEIRRQLRATAQPASTWRPSKGLVAGEPDGEESR